MSPVLVIAGPTAVGKSSLAHALAHKVGAEIVSADSRQVFDGLSVGTAKPTLRERSEVRYHLLDFLPPTSRFSAGLFVDCFESSITDIKSRGRDPVVVGGSTLYVHALVEGISDLPAVPRELEEELMVEASTPEGASRLFDELTSADPRAASTVDPTKTQRLVRWVGLWRSTGRPPSSFWTSDQAPPVQTTLVVLTRPRDELYRRINTRVVQMMEDGLLDEVASVLARFPDARPTLEATIGYRELLPVLAGDRSVEEGVRLIQRNTRRYAKRQLTWYRRYPGAIWLDASETTPERLLQYVGRSSLGGRSVEHPEGHSPSPAQDENDEPDS